LSVQGKDGKAMRTSLQGIAERARRQKQHRFQNLYGCLNEEYLIESWGRIRKDAAVGVDEVTAQEYEEKLQENVKDLVRRLKQKNYKAKPVRRHYIKKENGKKRPLGIPATEDKLLQLGVARILGAIYEEDFLDCSYGYRPKRSVHDALKELSGKIQFGAYRWIVEADIQGYFDSIEHEWMIRMLEERVDDEPFLRLIRKWLRAGVLDTDGQMLDPETGTPQGGIVSPILANVYLHYVLDLWFERKEKPKVNGKAFLIRYADDFVCGFERESEAKAFLKELKARLEKFGLKLSEEKTRIMKFDRNDPGRPAFDFLGFEHRWGKNRKGNPWLKQQTSSKKLRSAVKRMWQWCKKNRSRKVRELMGVLKRKLEGYFNHYGVVGNLRRMQAYLSHVERAAFKWLNRRSQKKSYTWKEFRKLKIRYRWPKPRIQPRFKQRELWSY
jgi:RNA-directed DNA polymerase